MKPVKQTLPTILSIFSLILFIGGSSFAEETQEFTPRVARISYLEGPVTIQRTVDDDWNEASLNLPLMVGDKIYTGVGGRAELQLDDQITVRLDSDTYIHFANLEDTLTRIGILKGAMAVHADDVTYDRAPVEILSDGFLAKIGEMGKIRFNVRQMGEAEILARRGDVIVTQGDQPYQLTRGDQLRITPAKTGFEKINQEDDFDQWSDFRDAMDAASVSRKHITSRVAGYSDLDRNGTWVDIPEYGTVWRPTVKVVDWAPYRDGRWAWYDSCGWTWVSYEPWGWVPYHYGRWVYVNRYNWCWVPHREIVYTVRHYPRPVWYPALVSFSYASHGRHFSFSIGGGHYYNSPCVGWFALGPRDPFHRWHHDRYYRDNRHYPGHGSRVENTRIVNNTYIDNSTHIYQNQSSPNAVTVVSEREFTTGKYENRAIASIDTKQRGSELAVGPNAIQKMEDRRILDAKPARAANEAGVATMAAKDGADRNGAVQAGTSRAERNVSGEPSVKSSRDNKAGTVRTNTARTANTEPGRDSRDNVKTGAAAARSQNTAVDTKPMRSPLRNQETSPDRTGNTDSAVRGTKTNSARQPLIQERPRTGDDTPRTETSSVRQEPEARAARTPLTNPNRTDTAASARTNSPLRSTNSETRTSAERSPLIQDRSASTTRESKPVYTNPARETQSTQSSRSTAPNSANSRYTPSRSYSQPRSNSTPSTPQNYYSPSRSYSQPQSYSSPSTTQNYSPSRSYSQPRSYSVPPASQSYSPSRSYSQPQSYSAPPASQSYSPSRSSSQPRSYSSPSRSQSYSPSRGSGSTSLSRTSPPR